MENEGHKRQWVKRGAGSLELFSTVFKVLQPCACFLCFLHPFFPLILIGRKQIVSVEGLTLHFKSAGETFFVVRTKTNHAFQRPAVVKVSGLITTKD